MCFNTVDTALIMEMAGEEGMVGPEYAYIRYSNQMNVYMEDPWVIATNPDINKEVFYPVKLVIIRFAS